METRTNAHHSPDGTWWWSGSEWLPAWSLDRRLWFNGTAWTRVGKGKGFTKPTAVEYVIAGAWFLLWVLSLIWTAVILPSSNAGRDADPTLVRGGIALIVGWLVLLPVCGFLLAHASRWFHVGALIAYVWVLLLLWYICAMLMSTPSGDGTDNDNAAGAGLVILGIPALFAVGALVGLGAGAGAAVRAISSHRGTN